MRPRPLARDIERAPAPAVASGSNPQTRPQAVLPRRNRLTRTEEFRSVYDQGRACRSQALVCIALAGPGEPTRAGIVASRKVGNAVQRNRAKRRLREALRLVFPELPSTGWRLVLIATPVTLNIDYGQLVDGLRRSLTELGVLPGGVPPG